MIIPSGEHLNPSDINSVVALQEIIRPTEGTMKLYTTNFGSVCMKDLHKGRSAFMIGGGPSLNALDLGRLKNARGCPTMALNNSWSLYKPDMWCCVDGAGRFYDTGWKDPSIMKFTPTANWNSILRIQTAKNVLKNSAFRVHQMPNVWMYCRSEMFDPATFIDEPWVCWGGPSSVTDKLGIKGKRSVWQAALKLLIYLGFKNIYMLGVDFKMTSTEGYAFGQSRTKEAIRHNNCLYQALHKRAASLLPHLKKAGINVYIANPDSVLADVFTHMPYEQMIEKASAETSKPVHPDGWYS